MRLSFLGSLLVSSLLQAGGLIAAEKIDVYLLGGQSNMEGLGRISELTSGQLAPPAGVKFWSRGRFVPMVPGQTPTAPAGKFGPEIAFAAEIAKLGRKACIVKFAASGMPLDRGWSDQEWLGDPPGPDRENFHPGESDGDPNRGTLYRDGMLPAYRGAIAAIIAEGDTPVVRAFVWMQGEQDSKNATSAGRYAQNLKHLRDRLAADLNLASPTDLPLVFGQVLPHEPAAPRFTHRLEIRASMAAADENSGSPLAIPRSRMVPTDGFPVSASDLVHYTTDGQLRLGKALAAALPPPRP